MAARLTIDDLPDELLCEILSRLSWIQQLRVRRVSRRWKATVDACLAVRRELFVGRSDVPNCVLIDKCYCRALSPSKTPAFGFRDSYDGVDESFEEPFYECDYCACPGRATGTPKLWFVEELCARCPRLQKFGMDDSCFSLQKRSVKLLLTSLPDLRSLALPDVEGNWLHLLPAGLQSLTLSRFVSLDRYVVRHMKRCKQLTHLELQVRDERGKHLTAVLDALPRLERLTLRFQSNPSWKLERELAHFPQMPVLKVAGCHRFEASGLLTDSGMLEQLRLRRVTSPLSTFRGVCLSGLIHLELRYTEIDDATLWRLGELMPNIRFLTLNQPPSEGWETSGQLTGSGLAKGLQQFLSLQVLDLGSTLNSQGVVHFLGALSLKALALDVLPSSNLFEAAELLGRCPTLKVICVRMLLLMAPGPEVRFIVDRLVQEHLQMHSEADVTVLIQTSEAWHETAPLPRNLLVMKDVSAVWDRLTGWQRWTGDDM